ncbi:hypothetical protein PKCEKB_PKCEKB_10830, partial [Dysosmobacter welbionis]
TPCCSPPFLFLAYHTKGALVCGSCNSRRPSSGSSSAAGAGSSGRGNSWGSTTPPPGRGSC